MPPSDDKQLVVKKSNDLIEARYKLTLGEQRLILLLASQIRKDDEDFKDYEVRVEDFAKWFNLGASSSVYEKVEQIADNLIGKVVTLKNDNEVEKTTWISYIKYIRGSGVVKLRFDKSLKPYLLQLKANFTQYNLSCVVNFKSSYSIRLYELLKMEVWKAEKAGKKDFEKAFEMEEYRKLLGIEKKAYPIFADLKKRVIEPTVQEITEQTDLEIFETRYIKTGRKITGVCFVVLIKDKNKRQKKEEVQEPAEEKQEIHRAVQALIDNGFSFENAKTYKTKYGVKQIERNLAYMQAEERNGKKIENRPAYLASAIREDWGQYREAEMKAKAEKEAKRREAERKAVENQTTLDEQIRENYKRAFSAFESMEKTKQDEIIFDFQQEADSFTLEQMRKAEKKGESPFSSTIAKATFTKFLIDKGF